MVCFDRVLPPPPPPFFFFLVVGVDTLAPVGNGGCGADGDVLDCPRAEWLLCWSEREQEAEC
jgi:hypothetical protein